MDPSSRSRVGFFKYWLFHDPNWDYRSIDWDRDLAYAEQKLPIMAAVDKDLTPFKKHGGKLIMYTGWTDPVVPPQDTVAYYEGVANTMGGIDKTRDFYRFFIAPGHGPLLRRSRPELVRSPDGARAVGRERHRAGQADRHAQHRRQGRSLAAALPLSAGRALEGHRQPDEAANFSCVAPPAATPPSKTTTTGGHQ